MLKILFFWVISHPIIILATPKSFILNSLISLFFSHFQASRLLEPRARPLTYILTMISFHFHWMVRLHTSELGEMKLILLKNLVIILFQSFPACFRPYRLFKILQTIPSWPTKHFCRILIKIEYLFWPSTQSRYTLITSIYMKVISSIAAMAKNILNDLYLTVGAKVMM